MFANIHIFSHLQECIMVRHTIKKENGGEKADKRALKKTEPSCKIEQNNK